MNSSITAPVRGGAAVWLLCILALAATATAIWYFAPHWLPDSVRKTLPVSPQAAGAVLYKWHDAKGGLHVTDVPPSDRPYETVRYDPNVNVVPSVMPPGAPPPKHDD